MSLSPSCYLLMKHTVKILNIDDINVTNFLSTYYRSVDLDVQKQIHQAIEKCVETGEEQTLYHPLKTCEKQITKAKTIL